MIDLSADGIRLTFDPRLGQIVSFTVTDGGADISPLHTAPWAGTDEPLPDGSPPHHRTLGGDFFCAPFGQEADGVPLHGWPANSEWVIERHSENELRARLNRKINGADLLKVLRLRDGHPFVYQRHEFTGLADGLPFANHANLALKTGGIIRTSPKRVWQTPPTALESDPSRGRSGLRYPARSTDPRNFPARSGSVDLTSYPWFDGTEDFVIGIEAPDSALGWTAVTRPAEGDLFLSLRNPADLPMTMLWHSNGGRDYPPWSGRHVGCLGIEEGLAPELLGPADRADYSCPIGSFSVSHIIGAIHWPASDAVSSIACSGECLVLTGQSPTTREVPFTVGWLSGSA